MSVNKKLSNEAASQTEGNPHLCLIINITNRVRGSVVYKDDNFSFLCSDVSFKLFVCVLRPLNSKVI